MPLNVYPIDPGPEYPVSMKPSYETNEVKFGDGYKVETPNGINNRTMTLNLSYTSLTTAEKNVIENFLMLHAPTTPFYVPATFDGQGGNYTCKDWTRDAINPGLYNMTATLIQYHGA